MGITLAKISLFDASNPSKGVEVELIVETRSILTWMQASKLARAGIIPRREKEFKTIEGHLVTRSTGAATIRFGGSEADIEVVFATGSDAEVLGVTALESLGYLVDPVSNELRPSSLLAL
jgi:predicted aspartyl protease